MKRAKLRALGNRTALPAWKLLARGMSGMAFELGGAEGIRTLTPRCELASARSSVGAEAGSQLVTVAEDRRSIGRLLHVLLQAQLRARPQASPIDSAQDADLSIYGPRVSGSPLCRYSA
jgi:hypothetical protein